ncbi:hypothetical protein BD410DRAFT_808884 [Rickenella mellea]|uniref:Uncharacterized protein n=1 Tax=Rickenella mellea TaxID=50990 RepID=A0A4Y7PLY8_9AGAM|nr:hypothetical protein BD410DRAFT_808884 [Rickenella mellea]
MRFWSEFETSERLLERYSGHRWWKRPGVLSLTVALREAVDLDTVLVAVVAPTVFTAPESETEVMGLTGLVGEMVLWRPLGAGLGPCEEVTLETEPEVLALAEVVVWLGVTVEIYVYLRTIRLLPAINPIPTLRLSGPQRKRCKDPPFFPFAVAQTVNQRKRIWDRDYTGLEAERQWG